MSYCASANNSGWPVYGAPAGYGILQRDPAPSVQMLWNWKEAVAEGKKGMDAKAGDPNYSVANALQYTQTQAYPFWIRQVSQWNVFNANLRSLGKPTAPPPGDQIEGVDDGSGLRSCRFTLPLGANGAGLATPTSPGAGICYFGDAILIKQFNGATYSWPKKNPDGSYTIDKDGHYTQETHNQNYISWKEAGSTGYWSVFKPNTVSMNTVAEVMSCQAFGPPRVCMLGLKPPSQDNPALRKIWEDLEIKYK